MVSPPSGRESSDTKHWSRIDSAVKTSWRAPVRHQETEKILWCLWGVSTILSYRGLLGWVRHSITVYVNAVCINP